MHRAQWYGWSRDHDFLHDDKRVPIKHAWIAGHVINAFKDGVSIAVLAHRFNCTHAEIEQILREQM